MEIIKKIINYGQTKEQLRYGMLICYTAILGATLGLVTGSFLYPDNPDKVMAGFILYIFMCISITLLSLSIIVTYLLRGDKADDGSQPVEQVSC